MKGFQGMIVAVGLGIAGAAVNWFYLSAEAQKIAMVSFVGVKAGSTIGRSETLKADKLVEVQIPKNAVGNLKQFAFLWEERATVTDRATWRAIDSNSNGATLLFRSDVQTPPAELDLSKGETAIGVPIDPKLVVTQLIKPGNWVSFRVPLTASLSMPTPASRTGTAPSAAPGAVSGTGAASGTGAVSGSGGESATASADGADIQPEADKSNLPPAATETIGPFKVLSVGNRLGDAEVWRAAKIPQLQGDVLMIRVSKNEAGEAERFEKLWSRLEAVGFHGVGVTILGKE